MVSLDKEERITKDKIQIMPWRIFLKQLWDGGIINRRYKKIPLIGFQQRRVG